jgi:hypothetical protein
MLPNILVLIMTDIDTTAYTVSTNTLVLFNNNNKTHDLFRRAIPQRQAREPVHQ